MCLHDPLLVLSGDLKPLLQVSQPHLPEGGHLALEVLEVLGHRLDFDHGVVVDAAGRAVGVDGQPVGVVVVGGRGEEELDELAEGGRGLGGVGRGGADLSGGGRG